MTEEVARGIFGEETRAGTDTETAVATECREEIEMTDAKDRRTDINPETDLLIALPKDVTPPVSVDETDRRVARASTAPKRTTLGLQARM